MALIKCPECGKETSDQAKVCTSCGIKLKKIPSYVKIIAVIIILIIGIAICTIIGKNNTSISNMNMARNNMNTQVKEIKQIAAGIFADSSNKYSISLELEIELKNRDKLIKEQMDQINELYGDNNKRAYNLILKLYDVYSKLYNYFINSSGINSGTINNYQKDFEEIYNQLEICFPAH